MKFVAIFVLVVLCTASTAVLPNYSPAIRNNALMREEIIQNYFNLGLTASENCTISHKCARNMYLAKAFEKNTKAVWDVQDVGVPSDLDEVVEAVEAELRG
ncbi:hypothetical protein OS493_038853, partial [Desmophyllum pertusum]